MDVEINIKTDKKQSHELARLRCMYEQLKNKESFNEDDIVLYKELLGHTSQDVNTLED